ncbi:MAG: M20 family metallopeptidase [bacterium]
MHNGIVERIRVLSQEFEPELIELRRTFHRYPELSWHEFRTAKRIATILGQAGYTVNSGVVKTGVVADYEGPREGKTLAIRADMDALPIDDGKNVPYASRIAGALHACGHDAHMAIAVGVAKALKRLNVDLPGKVRFIFQPSEESVPSGARELVNYGVMDGVDAIVAFHVEPELYAGCIGLRQGVLTAHCTEFSLTLRGKSGHAARPHQSIDTIYLGYQIVGALYDIVSKRRQQLSPAVLTIGKVHGGTKANVIPEEVEIAGTIRTVDEQTKDEILSAVEKRVHELTHAAEGRYKLDFKPPVPSVINDAELVELVRQVGACLQPDLDIFDIPNVSMGGEDFSWYQTSAPGVLIRLGARKVGGDIRHLHTHNFDIDERAIPIGVALMTLIAVDYLLR